MSADNIDNSRILCGTPRREIQARLLDSSNRSTATPTPMAIMARMRGNSSVIITSCSNGRPLHASRQMKCTCTDAD